MPLTLSPDQSSTFAQIQEWLEAGKIQQETLGGYAGTGKTTLVAHLLEKCKKDAINVGVCALAGKACSVLRRKGVPAQTIHSTIYDATKEGGEWTYTRKLDLPHDLIICDEASMVSTELYRDLLGFKIPILWVGDHGQLEPVGDNPGLMDNPHLRLEKIHRQAEGNPIIWLSREIRLNQQLPQPDASLEGMPSNYAKNISYQQTMGDTVVATLDEDPSSLDSQVIVETNSNRTIINREVRDALSYTPDLPVKGDKIICLRNNRNFGIFNGLMGVIVSAPIRLGGTVTCDVQLEDGTLREGLPISLNCFNVPKPAADLMNDPEVAYFDYGYAVTCHKAQGSQWKTVAVIGNPTHSRMPWDPWRWMYTAVTRASENLILCTS